VGILQFSYAALTRASLPVGADTLANSNLSGRQFIKMAIVRDHFYTSASVPPALNDSFEA
jgi:hypothetical protein